MNMMMIVMMNRCKKEAVAFGYLITGRSPLRFSGGWPT